MFHAYPIYYNKNGYHINRDYKIQPVSKSSITNNSTNNRGSDSSSFKEILETEIKKQKRKNKREG